mgnify:CR=1 FL=1
MLRAYQRADIFALGICLFEMLSGRMPFQDDSPLKLMLDVVQSETPDIRELNPDVDEEIGSDDPDEIEFEVATDNTPFIGVASQSKSRSVIAYYGIENHSKWVFTPLFRGAGGSAQARPLIRASSCRSSRRASRPGSRIIAGRR